MFRVGIQCARPEVVKAVRRAMVRLVLREEGWGKRRWMEGVGKVIARRRLVGLGF